MRFPTAAAAACLSLLAASAGFADAPPALHETPGTVAPGAAAPGAAAPAASASGTKPAAAAPAAPPSADAAAKHAKRTACLKDAKAKKLVGAEKNSFLKACIAAP